MAKTKKPQEVSPVARIAHLIQQTLIRLTFMPSARIELTS